MSYSFSGAVQHLLGRQTAIREATGKQGLADLLIGARRDTAGFEEAAERHGVAGLIYPDAPVALALRARSLRALKFTRKAVAAVEAANLPCVVLKGVAAAVRWKDPAARQQSDLDLLVAPADLQAATTALIDAGVASHTFMDGEHVHNASLKPKEHIGLTIELHHALNSNHEITVDVAELLRRRIRLQTAQGPVPALAPEDDAAYLAMHAATHALGRLAWLVDLEGLHRAGVDWVEAARRARAWNVAAAVEIAWRWARRQLAVPIPEAAFEALGTGLAQRAAVDALYRATWSTAGEPHKWLERAFRLALVPVASWPKHAVHKFQARGEQMAAYYPHGLTKRAAEGSLPR